MVESVVLAVLAFSPHPPLAALYATAAAGGLLLAFDNPVRRSFVGEMVPLEERANAVVLYSTIVNAARIVGPALAGALIITVGYGWCFVVDAASYVTVLVALGMMRPAELRPLPTRPRRKGDVSAAVRYVVDSPTLRITFVMLAVVGLLAYNFSVTLPLFVSRSLGGGDGAFTVIYATYSAGAVVSALVAAHRRLVRLQNVIFGSFALGASMLVLAGAPSMGFAVPAAFLLGIATILYVTPTTAIVQIEADDGMHGRILALQTVLLVGTAPLGGPVLGALADALGGRPPLVLGGLGCLSAGAWALRASRANAAPSPTSRHRGGKPDAPLHETASPVGRHVPRAPV
jgi:MFS family permease